jgi:hypothetical protein
MASLREASDHLKNEIKNKKQYFVQNVWPDLRKSLLIILIKKGATAAEKLDLEVYKPKYENWNVQIKKAKQ